MFPFLSSTSVCGSVSCLILYQITFNFPNQPPVPHSLSIPTISSLCNQWSTSALQTTLLPSPLKMFSVMPLYSYPVQYCVQLSTTIHQPSLHSQLEGSVWKSFHLSYILKGISGIIVTKIHKIFILNPGQNNEKYHDKWGSKIESWNRWL